MKLKQMANSIYLLILVAGKGGGLVHSLLVSSYVPFLGFPARLPLRRRAPVPF